MTEQLRQSAMRGGAYLMGRQCIAVLFKLIGVLLITRVLGPSQYGAYLTAFSVYQYGLLLGQAGIGVYLLRHHGDVPELAVRTSYTLLLGMAALLTGALLLSRGALAEWTGVAGYSEIMTVLALGMPFKLLSLPPTIALERGLSYRRVAIIEIGGDVAYYGLAVPLVMSHYGAVSLGIALLLQQIAFFGLSHYLSGTRPRFGFDTSSAQAIARYAAAFSFANWVWQLRMLVNPLIAAPVIGAHAVGLIGMTISILEVISIVKTVVWRLSVSVLGRIQHDFEKLRMAVTEGMELQTLVVGAMLLAFGWLGDLVVPVVFGARWAPVMEFYPYFATAYLSIATFNVHSAVLSVIDRNRSLGLCYVAHIVLLAGTVWVAVRSAGPIGYAFGEIAALPAYFLMHLVLARNIGSPKYGLTAWWWSATVIGLFWHELGIWAVGVPVLALIVPSSLMKLRGYITIIRKSRPPVTEAQVA